MIYVYEIKYKPIELKSFLVLVTLSHFRLMMKSVMVPMGKLSTYMAKYGRDDSRPFYKI